MECVVRPIERGGAVEVARVLNQLGPVFGAHAMVLPAGNALVVAAPREQVLPRLMKLIDDLVQASSAGPGGAPEAVSVQLKRSDVERVAGRLLELGQHRVVVVPDAWAQTIWLSGPADEVQKLARIATEMDRGAASAVRPSSEARPEPAFEVIGLEHARAGDLAATLLRVQDFLFPSACIVPDEHAQVLLVQAAPEEMQAIQKLVSRLDVPGKTLPKAQPAPGP